MLQETTFEQAKEETYSLFQKRCGELLQDFLSEKEKAVCSLCPESCTEIQKLRRALRFLIAEIVLEAVERCDDKEDIWVCILSPYLSTRDILKPYGHSKNASLIAREMEKGFDRLLAIIRRSNERQN